MQFDGSVTIARCPVIKNILRCSSLNRLEFFDFMDVNGSPELAAICEVGPHKC